MTKGDEREKPPWQVANLMEELQSLRQHLDEGEPAQKVPWMKEKPEKFNCNRRVLFED